jgi:hypothetical protein
MTTQDKTPTDKLAAQRLRDDRSRKRSGPVLDEWDDFDDVDVLRQPSRKRKVDMGAGDNDDYDDWRKERGARGRKPRSKEHRDRSRDDDDF